MPYAALARRSGVSVTTVVRALSGENPNVSFETVLAIAAAVGLSVDFKVKTRIDELREQQAEQKARQLIGMLQGTSGLEAQALDEETLQEMTRQTVHELLAGSPRRLWGE
jgi:transcriptional regulator with XRE-family HTH domain